MSVYTARRSKIKMRFPPMLANPKVRAVLVSFACSILVCFICFIALLNSKTMKQVIEEEVAKRFPAGYECSYTVAGVSPFGALDLENLTVYKGGRIAAFVDKCKVSGFVGYILGGGIVFSCENGFVYTNEFLSRGADSRSPVPAMKKYAGFTGINLELYLKKLTVIYGNFRDDWNVKVVWNGAGKRLHAIKGASTVDIEDIDLEKKSARIRMTNIDIEKYIGFAPELKGHVSGILGCDMKIAIGDGNAILADIADIGLTHASVSHPLLDDIPVQLETCGFSGTVFVSDTMQAVKGKTLFPGFEMPVDLYKSHNLVMGTISATKIPLDSIAGILKPSSGNLFANFKMSGDASLSLTFSARIRNRITLERLKLSANISNTKQLSNRLDFLKKQFYAYAFNEKGEIRRLTMGEKNPLFVSFDKLPKYVYGAILSCEDKGFFKHKGIDFWGIQRAIRNNFSKKSEFLQGGSTLSQQLAKNLFLTKKKYLVRKIEEMLLTWELEATLTKERMLEIYVNAIELGRDIFGIGRAAQTYFGKSAYDLTPLEAAYLASTLSRPRFFYDAFYAKNVISDYWQGRLRRLLNVMVTLDYLTPEVCIANDPTHFRFYTFDSREIIVSSGEAGILPTDRNAVVPE